MKRTLILSLGLALFAPIALVGCGDTTEVKKTEEVKTPGGKDKVETTVKETKTGDQK